MPDIDSAIIFSSLELKKIKEKQSDPNFKANNWNDNDLQNIKSVIRKFYRSKQSSKCAYCRKSLSIRSAANCQIEHIIAKTTNLNFIFNPKNLFVICADCNEYKRNQEITGELLSTTRNKNIKRYPTSSNAFKIIHPHFDNFDDHLIEINGYYLNKSKKGAYTILYCNLNRQLEKLGYSKNLTSYDDVRKLCMAFLSEKDPLLVINKLNDLKKLLIIT